MKKPTESELLECPACGARIALGKYAPLARDGRDGGCGAYPLLVPTCEADELLEQHRKERRQP